MGRLDDPWWVSDCARATVFNGDCIEVMASFEPNSVDAVVCDPPYGLEFMGLDWDRLGDVRQPGEDYPLRCRNCGHLGHGGSPCSCDAPDFAAADDRWSRMQAWHQAWAAQALRVLKPGGHLLAFGGSRTFHRLVCAVEDAGFEVRDVLMWLYGSGFPKSKNLTDEWQGWGSALKPAYEPVVMARKPMIGSLARNMAEYSVGALNIDATRTGTPARMPSKTGRRAATTGDFLGLGETVYEPSDGGRWPANVLLDEDSAAALDDQTGELTSGPLKRNADKSSNIYGGFAGGGEVAALYGDSGGASRFFYVAKADKQERQRGLYGQRNNHPTVKPAEVMRYLIRLVVPRGALVLDPFTGSGSTGLACLDEMVRFVGIERSTEYFDLACARIGGLADSTLDFGAAS